jgi:hypothetical protein
MRFEYILLVILSVFPLIYKLWYWQSIFQQQWNSILHFSKFFLTKEGRESVFHFWTALELPIFILSFVPLFNHPFEYLFYSMFFYFLVIYNVFVLWKIFRKKINLPVKNLFLCLVLSFVWIFFILLLVYPLSIYAYIASTLLFIPILLIISQLILNIVANKKA